MIAFDKKAQKLQEHIPIPQSLFYKYKNLADKAKLAQVKINNYHHNLSDAAEKIHSGSERDKLNLIAWGANILNDLLNELEFDENKWSAEEKEAVSKELAVSRIRIQELFPNWYKKQSARNMESLGDFKNQMKSLERNLSNLGLNEELDQLKEHVELVEKNIRHMEELKQVENNIRQLVELNKVDDATSMVNLNKWLEQVQILAKSLGEADRRISINKRDVRSASHSLALFQKKCNEQIKNNEQRLINIYNIEKIESMGEILRHKQEVEMLINVFSNDINAEDLFLVQKELDLLGNHFSLLDDNDLSEQEFETLLEHCREDMMNNFIDDSPPLDYDAIYKSIHKSLVEKRRGLAFIWIKDNLPALKDIYEYDANKALQVISNLRKKPKLLTSEQIQEVDEAIRACQKRVDDLEIEGLLAMFFNLSEEKQKLFFKKIESQIQAILPTHQIEQAPL